MTRIHIRNWLTLTTVRLHLAIPMEVAEAEVADMVVEIAEEEVEEVEAIEVEAEREGNGEKEAPAVKGVVQKEIENAKNGEKESHLKSKRRLVLKNRLPQVESVFPVQKGIRKSLLRNLRRRVA